MTDEQRNALIAQGWIPPLDEDGYEAWRPALLQFWSEMGWSLKAAVPLDAVDRQTIDKLRRALLLAPKEDRL